MYNVLSCFAINLGTCQTQKKRKCKKINLSKRVFLNKKANFAEKMPNPVIIIGANAYGSVAASVLQKQGLIVYGFLDDDEKKQGENINEIPVLGKTDDEKILKLIGKKCDVFIASDEAKLRKYFFDKLEEKDIYPVNIIEKSAFVADGIILGHGNLVQAGAVISAGADIGNCVNFGAGTILEPNVSVSDYVQIAAGAVIGEGVVLEECCFIGAGAVVAAGMKIEKFARVGAGSVVIENVAKGKSVFGNPAKIFG